MLITNGEVHQITRFHPVQIGEGFAVGGMVSRNRKVADLAGTGSAGILTGSQRKQRQVNSLDDSLPTRDVRRNLVAVP